MADAVQCGERLEGWKEIAEFLGVSDRTAQRHADPRTHDPLPIGHHAIKKVFALKGEVVAWSKRREQSYADHLAQVRADRAA